MILTFGEWGGQVCLSGTMGDLDFDLISGTSDLEGISVAVTAGGTREPIDPVRILTNRSSGKMGLALAAAAGERGADVTLLSAVDAADLDCETIRIDTVDSLRRSLLEVAPSTDILFMAAAVSDFRPVERSAHKIKKTGRVVLELESIPDFMHELPDSVYKVGFAAETRDLMTGAQSKFTNHGFDVVCANDVSRSDVGFEVDTNEVTVLFPDGTTHHIPRQSKTAIAQQVLEVILPRFSDWRRERDG